MPPILPGFVRWHPFSERSPAGFAGAAGPRETLHDSLMTTPPERLPDILQHCVSRHLHAPFGYIIDTFSSRRIFIHDDNLREKGEKSGMTRWNIPHLIATWISNSGLKTRLPVASIWYCHRPSKPRIRARILNEVVYVEGLQAVSSTGLTR